MSLWTEKEVEIILEGMAAGLKPSELVDKLPGRNLNAVSVKMSRLRSGTKQKSWGQSERQILVEYYNKCSMEELMEMLPGRTAGSIRGQVSYLRARGWSI